MLLSPRLSFKSAALGAVVPALVQILLKELWIGPRARRRKARKLSQMREVSDARTRSCARVHAHPL